MNSTLRKSLPFHVSPSVDSLWSDSNGADRQPEETERTTGQSMSSVVETRDVVHASYSDDMDKRLVYVFLNVIKKL